MIEPRVYYLLIEPEGEATTIAKSFVILGPVTDAVELFFLLFHRLRITASPHPYSFYAATPRLLLLVQCSAVIFGKVEIHQHRFLRDFDATDFA